MHLQHSAGLQNMCRACVGHVSRMCRVCVRQCIWKRDLRCVKIQSDEISIEFGAGFAHAAPNCPNLAQGAAEGRKAKNAGDLLEGHVSQHCCNGMCQLA